MAKKTARSCRQVFVWSLLALLVVPAVVRAQVAFPGASWEERTPAQVGLDAAAIDAVANQLGGDGVIVRNGYLVKKWGNFSGRGDWASAMKPVMSTLLWFAIEEGRIASVDALVRPVVQSLLGADLVAKDRTMTWRHLADMTSGYARGEAPGQAWAYNDYAIMLYSRLLFDGVFGDTPNNAALARLAALQFEDGGLFGSRGGRGLDASPRDFARIGWLWANRGNWNGNQLLPASYFTSFMKEDVPVGLPRTSSGGSDYLGIGTVGGGSDQTAYGPGIYGFNWWFNGVCPNGNRAWPAAPADTFQANGHWGVEVITVIPSLGLVAACRGNWGQFAPGDAGASMNQLLGQLAGAVLPDTPEVNISGTWVASGRSYQWGWLAVGKPQYIDRGYTFRQVPASYRGLWYLQTANDDKLETTAEFIRFTVDRPATVYLAYDARVGNRPGWLNGWQDTGAQLVTEDTSFTMLARDFDSGEVVLGGNACPADACSMYSVVVADRAQHDYLPGQIVVDPRHPSRMIYQGRNNSVGPRPVVFCGPGDPEDFFYNDTQANLDLLVDRGARCTYITAYLQDFGGGNPGSGSVLEQTLDGWDALITTLENAGVITVFFFFDDSQPLPADWQDAVDRIVNRLEHHPLLIWSVAEEYSESLSSSEVAAVAARIRAADDHDHVVGVHQLSGTTFDFNSNPDLQMFLMQLPHQSPDGVHASLLAAGSDTAGAKILNMAEMADHGQLDRTTVRRVNWAAIMGGASAVQVIWMGRASDDATWNEPGRYQDCAVLMDFFEATDVNSMSPRDDLACGGTRWVLADPGHSYIAYAYGLAGDMCLKNMTAGSYDFTWLDAGSGVTVEQTGVEVAAGDASWPKPDNIGAELAVWIRPAPAVEPDGGGPDGDGGLDGGGDADGGGVHDGDEGLPDGGRDAADEQGGADDNGPDGAAGDDAATADGSGEGDGEQVTAGGCGCSAAGAGSGGWLVLLVLLAGWLPTARRR